MATYEFHVKIIIYIEIILLILGTLGAVVVICLPSVYIDSLLLEHEPNNPDKRAELKSELGILIAITAAVVVIILLVWLIIVIILYVGSKERSLPRLTSWLIINSITVSLQIFLTIATLIYNYNLAIIYIPSLIFLIYRIYSLYIIRSFIIEIKFKPQPTYLSVQYNNSGPYYSDINYYGGGGNTIRQQGPGPSNCS